MPLIQTGLLSLDEMKIIAELLHTAVSRLVDSSSAQLDAEVLLAYVLKKDRSFLRAWPEQVLDEKQRKAFRQLIEQRVAGVPVAYLTGCREFWSRSFKVSPDVLIPRPETELLVELALEFIDSERIKTIVDVGTGSGAIAVTLAAERPVINVIATDVSGQALAIARENAKIHQVNPRIAFVQTDWLKALSDQSQQLIISNPPYIADDDPHLLQGDVRFEPRSALISGNSGVDALTTLALQASKQLVSGGCLMLEHGCSQAHDLKAVLLAHGFSEIKAHTDLSGHLRITTARVST